jgi:hypothetical protein
MRGALVLDLDGVLIHETLLRAGTNEIIRLHENLGEQLDRVQEPVFVVTHRSRLECQKIFQALPALNIYVTKCFVAEDIMLAGLTQQPAVLFRKGLRKSFILPVLFKRWGVFRTDICFVDDCLGNIEDVLAAGVGLGIVAPIGQRAEDEVVTFNLVEMIDTFLMWMSGGAESGANAQRLYHMTPRAFRIDDRSRSGLSMDDVSQNAFNVGRLWARKVRLQSGLS